MLDLKLIKSQVKAVLAHSQQLEENNLAYVDKIVDEWMEAKRDFIESMNGECIYTYPEKVTFELSQNERTRRLNDFIEELEEGEYNLCSLADFVRDNTSGFYSNRVVEDYTFNGHTIHAGEKLVKCFKHFVKDDVVLNKMQTMASMIIQEDKVSGYLCVSVHPLDFLSSSENNMNWRSCHALDGCYRSGNISYMLDSSTVMVYLRTEKNEKLPHFPIEWNNKKWRTLIFFSTDWNMLFAGRSYPFASINGLQLITEKLLPKAGLAKATYSSWYQDQIRTMTFNPITSDGSAESRRMQLDQKDFLYPVGYTLIKADELIKDAEESAHYNDLLYSSCYIPYYCYAVNGYYRHTSGYSDSDETRFKVGAATPCVICGNTSKENLGSDSFLCIECEEAYGHRNDENFAFCEECGRHYHYTHGRIGGDRNLCEECLDKYYVRCHECGELVERERAVEIDGEMYCRFCGKIQSGDIKVRIEDLLKRISKISGAKGKDD